MSGAATNTKFVFTGRWIPEKSDAGQLFFSGAYWLTKQWSVGLDYRPLVDKVYPNSNLRVLNSNNTVNVGCLLYIDGAVYDLSDLKAEIDYN